MTAERFTEGARAAMTARAAGRVEGPQHATREAWYAAAVDELRELYASHGHVIPRVRVGVGYPSAGRRSTVIGECWTRNVSGDASHEIIIRIDRTNAADTLAILMHELAHAVDANAHGHGREFGAIVRPIGLEGPPTATHASDDLRDALTAWAAYGSLGAYPAGTFAPGGAAGGGRGPLGPDDRSSGPPKQGTRMIKAWCDETGNNLDEIKKDGKVTTAVITKK